MSHQWGPADAARLNGPGADLFDSFGRTLTHGQYAVVSGEAIIYGSREQMAALGRTMAATFAARNVGPAVTFDADGFRAWLESPNEPGVEGSAPSRQVGPLLSTAHQRLDGHAGWLVETTLDMLRGVAERPHPAVPAPWAYGDGVSGVKVWATAAAEGGSDGGLVGEVTVDGTALSLGRLTEEELVPAIYDVLPGYEAAEHALAAVADRVNDLAARFRAAQARMPADGPFDELDTGDIERALFALAEYTRGNADLSNPQKKVAERVAQIARGMDEGEEAIDGEFVDDDEKPPYRDNETAA